jgi:hypothetical protein
MWLWGCDKVVDGCTAAAGLSLGEVTCSARGPRCSYLNGELYEELYARQYNKFLSADVVHRVDVRGRAFLRGRAAAGQASHGRACH